MPIDKSRVDRMISMIDDYLKQLEQDRLDENEEDCDEYDITNPLEAQPNPPFADSPPQQIHGELKKDLFSL